MGHSQVKIMIRMGFPMAFLIGGFNRNPPKKDSWTEI